MLNNVISKLGNLPNLAAIEWWKFMYRMGFEYYRLFFVLHLITVALDTFYWFSVLLLLWATLWPIISHFSIYDLSFWYALSVSIALFIYLTQPSSTLKSTKSALEEEYATIDPHRWWRT